MECVLISIKPKWCELTANGEKTIEVRKTKPKLNTPFKCYIYCKKVIGEFMCDNIYPIRYEMDGFADAVDCETSCLKPRDFIAYGKGKQLYGWHISDLKIYDEPKELSDFTRLRETKFGYEPVKIERPPQSWCYVEEV